MRVTLVDLEGVSEPKIKAEYCYTPEDMVSLMSENRAVTSAGHNGAFNIWKDDNGKIHCASYKDRQTIEHLVFDCLDYFEIEQWAEKWFKIIHFIK